MGKFEGDRPNTLEVMLSQTQEFRKAIRPLFIDPVTIIDDFKTYGFNFRVTTEESMKWYKARKVVSGTLNCSHICLLLCLLLLVHSLKKKSLRKKLIIYKIMKMF